MVQDYDLGGCRMIHLESFIKALKLTWVRRLIYNDSCISKVFTEITKCNFRDIEDFGDDFYAKKYSLVKNLFWKEFLGALSEFKLKLPVFTTKYSILNCPLWNNSRIKIDKNTIFWKKWYDEGIIRLKDILKEDKRFLSLEELEIKLNMKIPFTKYEGIKRTILQDLKFSETEIDTPLITEIEFICKHQTGSRHIYDIFIKSFYIKPKSELK